MEPESNPSHSGERPPVPTTPHPYFFSPPWIQTLQPIYSRDKPPPTDRAAITHVTAQ